MIEIHHVPATRGVRPIWLCEELGLDYEIHPVDFSAEYRASKEWRAMNPVGKVPVMIDTNADNLTMFESGAMVQYLLCLLYTSPSPRDQRGSGVPSWA